MRTYEITYTYDGKEYTVYEQAQKDEKSLPEKTSKFLQRVLNRIESIVNAGAVVTDITEYPK